jgi:beta-phosphoglucomutase
MDAAVLFDMDGVLVDSYRPHLASWAAMAEEEGLAFDEADFVRGFGRTSRELIAHHWPARTADAERLDRRKEELYRELVAERFPAMPGAVELLAALAETGLLLAVASSGPPENVELVLDRLGAKERFAAVVTGSDVSRGKPDPEVFLLAAERLRLPPSSCVVVEDAPLGVEAAHAAAMPAVALLSTGRRREDFTAAAPELVVGSLRELDARRLRELLAPAARRQLR